VLAGKLVSVRARFAFFAAILGIVVVAVSAIVLTSNRNIEYQATQLAERQIPLLNKAHEVKLRVIQVQQWLTDISATRARDGLNDGFDEAENNAQRFKMLIDELQKLDTQNASRYQGMLPTFDAYYQVGKRMAQAYIEDGPAGGNVMMAEFDDVAARMSAEVDSLLADIQIQTNTVLDSQNQTTSSATTIVWVAALVVLGMVGFLYFIISHALSYLPRAVDELQRIAEGDLTSTFDLKRGDEIGQLVGSMEVMRSRLLMVMSQIMQATDTLSSSSAQMSAVTSRASDSIQRQRSETEQVATAMNEMTATVQEVASNITHTAGAAHEANSETLQGKKIVEQAVGQIRQLAGQIESAADTIHRLEQNSQEITTVLDVIRGVAEQTNLLALNAAIEAARAGEQGRGFAVVADEVRTLASRTQESTEEINQMIDKLRSGTRQAVDVMNNSREQARTAVERASTAGDSLSSIANAVARINDMSNQIASAAEEQSAVSEEINRNIVRISDMTDDSAEGASQTSAASQELARIAGELKSLVGQFRI